MTAAASMNEKICQRFPVWISFNECKTILRSKEGVFWGTKKAQKVVVVAVVVVVEVFAAFNEKFDERAPTLPQANHWPVTPS